MAKSPRRAKTIGSERARSARPTASNPAQLRDPWAGVSNEKQAKKAEKAAKAEAEAVAEVAVAVEASESVANLEGEGGEKPKKGFNIVSATFHCTEEAVGTVG